jgi:hypothetical protein
MKDKKSSTRNQENSAKIRKKWGFLRFLGFWGSKWGKNGFLCPFSPNIC